MRRKPPFFLLVALTVTSSPINAQQTTTIYEEYGKLAQRRGSVIQHDGRMFGDQLSLYSGALEFVQQDANLPGNGPLPVAVGRRFVPQQPVANLDGLFADWDIDLPHMHGVFSNTKSWPTTGSGFTSYKRCTEFGAPPVEVAQQSGSGGYFAPGEYWQGNFLYLPGTNSEEILIRDASVTPPTDGRSYRLTTQSGAMISCLATMDSGVVGAGEGFEVVTADGVRYRLDHLVKRQTSTIMKSSGAPEPLSLTTGGSAATLAAPGYQLRRNEVWILPTLATDRFGNSVTYNWGGADGWALQSIVSSDGRRLDFSYVGGSFPHRVASMTDGIGTWIYTYTGDRLTDVRLPDGSRWTFDLEAIRFMPDYLEGGGCASEGMPMYGARTGSITHPSGAIGTFTLNPVTMGRTDVPNACIASGSSVVLQGYDRYPLTHIKAALTSKLLQGAGLPATGLRWTYDYGSSNACYLGSCTSSTVKQRIVTEAQPGGRISRSFFGNRFQVNEGKLLRLEQGASGQAAMRITTFQYADPNSGPFPASLGIGVNVRSDAYLNSTHHTPLVSKVITEGGVEHRWQVASDCSGNPYCFDTKARPLKLLESSGP